MDDNPTAYPSRAFGSKHYKSLLGKIISAYDSPVVRFYSMIRFKIININILHILALCLRGKRRILDIGCGFGLFGCYFASLYPDIQYVGFDLNRKRINMANQAAERLGLSNARFLCRDARELQLEEEIDAVMVIDLLHHLDESAKESLLETFASYLSRDGRLIIKDVSTRPFPKVAFTWLLDVIMTGGFEMWYWNEDRFATALGKSFDRVDMFPISDWLPYPHIVYLCENSSA